MAKKSSPSIQASASFVLTSTGIAKVAFTGDTTAPTVTITGKGFGSAPSGMSDNVTGCGAYTNNGDDYGTSFYFTDTGNFVAGQRYPAQRGVCRADRRIVERLKNRLPDSGAPTNPSIIGMIAPR